MKTMLMTIALMLAAAGHVGAQEKEKRMENKMHRVVFELTSESPEGWESLLNNVENLRKSLGNKTEVEVVVHGKAIGFLLKTNDKLQERMKKNSEAGVVFAACENTMKKKNISKDNLLPFVTTVDSGVAEVVRKQGSGWSYVKSGG